MSDFHSYTNVKALGLTSGGLDSILAALVLQEQGIDVTWVSFKTPFFSPEEAVKAAERNGIPLKVVDITDDYMPMLENPRGGYGKNMNPCMDCHALMFARAGEIMNQEGFDFLFSGEVAGQRPMSQTKNAMRYVAKNSGFDGFILRPLSARLLPPSFAEEQGLVDREKLCALSGRSRKPQLALAERFGVKVFPAPAGGCLLTDKGFSARLKDLMQVQKSYETRELYLLRHGRHLRLDSSTKAVAGRSKQDNENILTCYREKEDLLIHHASLPGPVVLIPRGAGKEADLVKKAAAICAGYTKTEPGDSAVMRIISAAGSDTITVSAVDPAQAQALMI